VDLLKIIQLGLTFFNKDGELPEVLEFSFHTVCYVPKFTSVLRCSLLFSSAMTPRYSISLIQTIRTVTKDMKPYLRFAERSELQVRQNEASSW